MTRVDVETAREMLAACEAALPADAAVCVAAVADWRADEAFAVEAEEGPATGRRRMRLVENPDILATLAAPGPRRPRLVVGFAAETSDLEAHARAKLAAQGLRLDRRQRRQRGRDHGRRRERGAAGLSAGRRRAGRAPRRPRWRGAWPSASPRIWRERRPRSPSCACRTARACRCRPTRPPHAAGMDLRAAVPEDEPLTLRPGDRRRRAHRPRHRHPARLRGPGAAALRPGAARTASPA